MQIGRGKIFLEFVNNFPLACDQEWLATFLSYQEETRLQNEKTLNLVSPSRLPRP